MILKLKSNFRRSGHFIGSGVTMMNRFPRWHFSEMHSIGRVSARSLRILFLVSVNEGRVSQMWPSRGDVS